MKLILNKHLIKSTAPIILMRAGYNFFVDPRTAQESYVRPLGRNFYPRFHIYLQESEDEIEINLHLDQKRPSYEGAHAHNAEYDGEVVEQELNRIKRAFYQ